VGRIVLALRCAAVAAVSQSVVIASSQHGGKDLRLTLRTQVLKRDEHGHNYWQVASTPAMFKAGETAIILCDVWDKHWSRGATERVAEMAPRMNEVVKAARTAGVAIVHAPSDTMDFYRDTPARKRVAEAPRVRPPPPKPHEDPAQPIDASDGGSDTNEPKEKVNTKAWSRQHPAIEIDQERDGISDNGSEVYNFLKPKGVKNIIIMGVHTNMCVLGRSFAIKQMVRWGMNVALVRDLTDAMYNPARPPYVSHQDGTRLVIEYIEKFWCPTIDSEQLLNACR
jgi:nicotinamidase-related amidase